MEPFTTLSGPAAAFFESGIDTDVIFPARFLLLMDREGLGEHLFHDRRFASDGAERPGFVLNRKPFRGARFLVAGEAFGCGSSREHAVWALADFGVRCVIAPSFGEIFHANCFNNGVLPVQLPMEACARLARRAEEGCDVHVDLRAQVLRVAGETLSIAIDASRREALLNGRDEIELILREHGAEIAAFERRLHHDQPWLFA